MLKHLVSLGRHIKSSSSHYQLVASRGFHSTDVNFQSEHIDAHITNITPVESLSDLGLGNPYLPHGVVQIMLDHIHSLGSPWWLTIGATALTVRILLIPVFVSNQRIGANMFNNQPQYQEKLAKLQQLIVSGDLEASITLRKVMQNHNRQYIWPMLRNGLCFNAPLFCSTFFAIRQMALAPVASFSTGGTLWFENLCAIDSTGILPLITSSSVFLILKFAADTPTPAMNYIAIPISVVIFLCLFKMPSALLVYWAVSNVFQLMLVPIFKTASIRRYFSIPTRIIQSQDTKPTFSFKKTFEDFRQMEKEYMEKQKSHRSKYN